MLESIVYLIFCALTGLCGIDRRMGFFGTFLLAIVTTPLVVLPILLLTGPSRRMEWHRRNPRTVVLSGVASVSSLKPAAAPYGSVVGAA